MELEIRLKKVLREAKLDYFGVTQDMAKELGVHRHTIGKLYRSQATHPSLEVLGQVCGWLERKGVDAEKLPRALFGLRPSGLWQAMSEPGCVDFYTGERQETDSRGRVWNWIAQHDALVLAKLMQFLSGSHEVAQYRPTMHIEYVPIRLDMPDSDETREEYKKDEARAKKALKDIQALPTRSTILIGSQRVNQIVEPFVADLFGCKPFRSAKKDSNGAPFFLRYREDDRPTSSCFGGHTSPPGFRGKAVPGLYYLQSQDRWEAYPWVADEQDAGVVIISRESATGSFQMALFGYSGPGTEALGEVLLRSPNRFWPPLVESRGRNVGVFVCRFKFHRDGASESPGRVTLADAEVVPIDAEVLKQHLP